MAFYLMTSSKKGVARISFTGPRSPTRSAWFLAHRIREAMRDGWSSSPLWAAGVTCGSRRNLFCRRTKLTSQPTLTKEGKPYKYPKMAPDWPLNYRSCRARR